MISAGAIVVDQRGETWVAHSQTDDGRRCKCVRRFPDGRFSSKSIGQGDLVEVEPASLFEPGLSILHDGEVYDVVQDLGDAVELLTPDRRRLTRAGEHPCVLPVAIA